MQKLQNFIAGDWRAPASSEWFDRECPITGEIHASVPDSDLLDLVHAVQAANKAWALWQKEPAQSKAPLLTAIAERIEAEIEALARVQCEDIGAPIAFSRELIRRSAELFRYHAAVADTPLRTDLVTPQGRFRSNHLPIGLVGLITPWSEAFYSLASRVAPALRAGNVIVAKPSEYAPRTAEGFARILAEAGLPAGVFNMVQGRGGLIGRHLVSHPGISTIAFTGRTSTGKELSIAAAEGFKRTHLALGARNAVVIFAESKFEELIPAIASLCLGGSHRSCLRGSRLFVQETIYERFFELFKTEIENAVIGDPRDEKTTLGPLISAAEKGRYLRATEQALGENGKPVLTNNFFATHADAPSIDLARGHFVRPVLVRDLTLCSTLQQEEVIGPFMTVSSFKYQHDAVKHANNCPLGQAAYIFHSDLEKVARVASKIEASRIFINRTESEEPAAVVAGMKSSGQGREGGDELLRFFSRESLITGL